jgi:hypothetical protein
MKPTARTTLSALALLLTASLLSGCIVHVEDIWCESHARRATLYVYVKDYYSGAPIHWAMVELYESDWWSWDYIGTWEVNDYGYVVVRDGYLGYDGCSGPEEKDFLIVVNASGYYSNDYEIELSYYYPSETLTFYLMPYYGREAGEDSEDAEKRAGRVDVGSETDDSN